MAKKNGKTTTAQEDSMENTALAVMGGAGGLPGLRTLSAEEMADALKGRTVLPPVVSLDDSGKSVCGVVEGPGQEVEFTDKHTGEERLLKTWRFNVGGGVRVDVLSAHALDKALPDLVGKNVLVVKGGTKKVGAKQVNQYIIAPQQ